MVKRDINHKIGRQPTYSDHCFADFIKISSVLTDVPIQASKFLYDEDYNFQKSMRNSSKTILDLIPAQSLWYTKMLYRKYIHEYTAQLVDPKGFRKRQKNLRASVKA